MWEIVCELNHNPVRILSNSSFGIISAFFFLNKNPARGKRSTLQSPSQSTCACANSETTQPEETEQKKNTNPKWCHRVKWLVHNWIEWIAIYSKCIEEWGEEKRVRGEGAGFRGWRGIWIYWIRAEVFELFLE